MNSFWQNSLNLLSRKTYLLIIIIITKFFGRFIFNIIETIKSLYLVDSILNLASSCLQTFVRIVSCNVTGRINVVWYIQGQYNSNATTLEGVPANKTAWTGPIAASVFQDIRSDNWDGDTPPDIEDPDTYGTEGYYIQQETGDVYFNNGIFRGNISGASGTFSGDLITTGKLSLTGSGNVIAGYTVSQYIYSSASYACIYANNTANASVATFYTGNARTIYAQNTSTFSGNPSIYGDNLGNGAGVQATSNTGTALIAYSSTGNSFDCQGTMTISSSAKVTNLNSEFSNIIKNTANTQSLKFVAGTVVGTATATFIPTNKPGSATGNEWIKINIDGTDLYIPAWT